MKILIYAGCHGGIIKAYLEHSDSCNTIVYIQNWEIIENKSLFPSHEILDSSAIIFSPVLNKPGYNTAELFPENLVNNKLAYAFPWLQWNGEFPHYRNHADAGQGFGDNYNWWYSSHLKQLAKDASSYQDFANRATCPSLYSIEEVTDLAKQSLDHIAINQDPLCNFKLGKAINNHSAEGERLFLIPDHPSNIIYKLLLPDIGKAFNIPFSSGHRKMLSQQEPFHCDSCLPVLPSVCAAMNLDPNKNSLFRNIWKFNGDLSLEEFLIMHYDYPFFEKKYMHDAC